MNILYLICVIQTIKLSSLNPLPFSIGNIYSSQVTSYIMDTDHYPHLWKYFLQVHRIYSAGLKSQLTEWSQCDTLGTWHNLIESINSSTHLCKHRDSNIKEKLKKKSPVAEKCFFCTWRLKFGWGSAYLFGMAHIFKPKWQLKWAKSIPLLDEYLMFLFA